MSAHPTIDSEPPNTAKSPARLPRWLRRWPWLVAVVLMIVIGIAVVPAILQYRAIQEIETLGGMVETKPLEIVEALPKAWRIRLINQGGQRWMKAFEQVTFVHLSGNSIQEHDLRNLTRIKKLQYLDVICPELREGGLPHIRNLKFLKALHLTASPVTDTGLIHLKELAILETLTLDATKITDQGLIHLKDLAHLHFLWLETTQVTDAGLIQLKEMPQLKVLSLTNTEISDAGLVHLKEMTWLEVLHLKQTKITPAGIQELQAALPTCGIRY